MDLIEIKNILFEHFKENPRLILPDDKLKLIKISEYPEFDTEAIKIALKDFESAGLVKSFSFIENKKEKSGYILERPIQTFEQTVNISGELAYYIANTINKAREDLINSHKKNYDFSNQKDSTDPLKITSTDIETLLILLGVYYDFASKKDSTQSEFE